MESNSSTPIDPRLEPVLRRLRKRIRGVLASRGALITAFTALAGLLALVAIDFAFAPLPAFVRWMSPVVFAAAVTAVAVIWWWLPLSKPLELVRVARWLETHHPELDERISTVLEVSRRSDGGMSSQLIEQLAKEASGSLDQINPSVEVSTRRAKQWLWPAAALLLVWAALFVVWPDPTVRHVVRALVPTSNLGNAAGRITVTPGSAELIEGDSFQITAVHSAGASTKLELILHLPDGTSTVMPMELRDGGSIHQLGRADRSFEYEVRSGRETSDRFKVTVWPQPRLTDPRVRLEFPTYTGWAPREQALSDGISAINGTKVELKSKLNTPVESVRLEIDEETAGDTTIDRAADGGTFSSRWTLEKTGHSAGRVVLKHRIGREFEAARFMIESTIDAPPEVKWLSAMKKETRLRPDDLLEMGYEITDDVGLGAVELEIQPERGEGARLPVDAPPRIGRAEPPAWRGRIQQPIGEIVDQWPQCRVFKLRVRAEDSRPAEMKGPGVGTSEWVVIRIDQGAESLARQEVAAAQSDARETLEEARQSVQQAREKIDRRREDLKNAKVPEYARKELEQAREQLADARQELEELADRMEESVNADKAPDVRKAAETIEQARQQLENTPLQDTPEQRDQSAAEARENAEKAQRQLEKLREEIQRDEAQVRDYAHLKELEQQQRELARQAEQALAQNPQDPAAENKPEQPWQQQQDRVAEALRQEAQQQPQAQAAALEQQAQQAKQLAQEAREQAAGQDALKQLAQDPNAAKEGLHEQLAKEQADIATDAQAQLAEARERQDNATANALPEAVESAEKASAEISQQNKSAAANEAKEAAAQLAEAAKTAAENQSDQSDPTAQSNAAAELSDLAERQENVAEALAALEQGKPAEAAAQLAEMRAEQAAELAEDIRETPQVNGTSGPMQQAANSSEQAAGQAKQAAQSDSQGKPAEASASHGQSSQQLQQTAAQLDQAAAEFAQQAAEAAGRQAGDHKAPVPAQPLAEAFQQASQAADSNNEAAAASHAQAAADALAQAADGALRAMQGQSPPKPGQGMPQEANQPGMENTEALRSPEADPGVPPELAKVGISAEDWEKIKSSLKSDVGGSAAIALPEEYRDLVRSYFEQMSKGDKR